MDNKARYVAIVQPFAELLTSLLQRYLDQICYVRMTLNKDILTYRGHCENVLN